MSSSPHLHAAFVTTTLKPSAALIERAQKIAARLGWPLVPRTTSLRRLREAHGASEVYIVGSIRDEVQTPDDVLFVHTGMFYLKRDVGAGHPLIRAIAPPEGAAPRRVIDATLGLGGDALFLAWALDAQIVGLESSPVIFSLLEEGLARMAATAHPGVAEPALRIQPVHADACEWLAAQPPASVDVVYLDPMFTKRRRSPPGYSLFRQLAHPTPLNAELLSAACRVAAARVVVKIPGATAAPTFARFDGRIRGQAVDYLVVEHELPARDWATPDMGAPPDK